MIKMHYALCISLAFLTTAHGMEPSKEIIAKEKDKKSFFQSKSSKKSVSLNSLEHKEIYIEHLLITAARNKDHDTIKFHLSNRYFNPNVQNLELNTPFHEAAINCDKIAIQLFLNDPRIDASIKNINNKTARDLVDIAKIKSLINSAKLENPDLQKLENLDHSNGIKRLKNGEGAMKLIDLTNQENELLELRRTMFARATLDIITTQECTTIRPTYQQGLITAILITETIQKIRAKIRTIEEKQAAINQGDAYGNLPSSALMPLYATDNFIMDMIFFRLSLHAINKTWLK